LKGTSIYAALFISVFPVELYYFGTTKKKPQMVYRRFLTTVLIPGQSTWDLWWVAWCWGTFYW